MQTGGNMGIPIVDVKVECLDGKTHSVDSSDMAFKTAAASGFSEAIERGAPLLLEPISVLTVRVPVDAQGDVLGDLSSRRGRIASSVTNGDGEQVITAEVPTPEIGRYAMDLRAMTAGRGRYSVRQIGHDVLPDHLAKEVLAEYDDG